MLLSRALLVVSLFLVPLATDAKEFTLLHTKSERRASVTPSKSPNRIALIYGPCLNNEELDEFRPAPINYTFFIDEAHEIIVGRLAKRGISILSDEQVNELMGAIDESEKSVVNQFVLDILSILHVAIQTGKFPRSLPELSFANLSNYRNNTTQWEASDPIFAVVSLEDIKFRRKDTNYLGGMTAVVKFSGAGEYLGMQLSEYDYTRSDGGATFAGKIERSLDALL
jgi:hypothetical protein